MALIPVANTLGLWQDPNWEPAMPGLYAVIVGVSNYPHLRDGSAPAKETFDLGQLEVSARTAAAVFDWLRSDYQHADLPVVWCYLLLSPSEVEKSFLQNENVTHYENPTDSQLRHAIQLWCSYLPIQGVPAGKSRTLFFFSGHGVQSNWDPLLLPSDYLFPPDGTPGLENCVSTKEMMEWMKTHPVGEHFALFDACRNEFSPLRNKASTANRVFPKNPPGPPPRVVASVSATAPNSVAYQSRNVEEFTFFGQALIEGLDGAGGKATVHRAGALDVEFMDLVKYVKPRVMQILQKHNTTLEQTAQPSLDPCDANLIVTQIPAEAPLPGRSIARSLSTKIKTPLGPSEDKWPEDAEKIQDSHFNIISADMLQLPVSAFRDFTTAHGYFGHEYASGFWEDFQLYALSDRRPLSDDKAEVHRVTRDVESTIVRVDMELSPEYGGILAAFAGMARGLQALPLPTDEEGRVPIRLTLTFDRHSLLRVEGQLGPSKLAFYDYLWKLCRIAKFASFADAAKQAEKVDWRELRMVVEYKRMATTAAIAGAIILACGGKIRMVKDWTRNLMNWFPNVPDGAVLWVESLRAAIAAGEKKPFGVSDPLGEMVDALESLERRGVPFFVDVIDLLDSQLRYLDGLSGDLSNSQLSSLATVRRMTNRVFQVACPSGHFLMLAALPRPASLGETDKPLKIEEMLKILRPALP
jgi:hypothetical protein